MVSFECFICFIPRDQELKAKERKLEKEDQKLRCLASTVLMQLQPQWSCQSAVHFCPIGPVIFPPRIPTN